MFKNPFSFQGRIRRTEYALSVIILIIWNVISALFSNILPLLFNLIGWYFIVCQGTKRSHDLGKSWIYQFIPYLNLRLCFVEGEKLPNKHGRNPKAKRLLAKKESLESVYRVKLEPILLKLDKERRVILAKLVLQIIMSIVLWLSYVSYFSSINGELQTYENGNVFQEISFWFIFALMLLFIFFHRSRKDDYHKRFKKAIMTPLVKLICKSSVYNTKPNHKQRISIAKRFVESEIFGQWYPINYQGELDYLDRNKGGTVFKISDFVSWQTGNNNIELSVLECHQHIEENSILEEDVFTPLFEGLFFSIDFNKNFNGETFLLRDYAERKFGLIGQELQSVLGGDKELIRLESEEFEKIFVVYSDDQIEARYILSPSLMEKIVKFQNSCFGQIQMSFVKNQLHIAIRSEIHLFEPELYKSIVNFNDIAEYYHNLTWVAELVEELNLNREIWKKS